MAGVPYGLETTYPLTPAALTETSGRPFHELPPDEQRTLFWNAVHYLINDVTPTPDGVETLNTLATRAVTEAPTETLQSVDHHAEALLHEWLTGAGHVRGFEEEFDRPTWQQEHHALTQRVQRAARRTAALSTTQYDN
jgi:hypothetical protein